MKLSSFMSDMNKLKHVQSNLESKTNVLIEQITKYVDFNIFEFLEQLSNDREEVTFVYQSEVRTMLTSLNNIIESIKNELIDFNQLRSDMISLQTDLMKFKTKTRSELHSLQIVEAKLDEEIKIYNKKLVEWEDKVKIPQNFKNYEIANNSALGQDVKHFLEFISKSNGHENGWSLDDHTLFLKTKKLCKNTDELCNNLHAVLPDISKEEILRHDNWYSKYLELKDKHKQAIKNWRETKSAPAQTEKDKNEGDGGKRVISAPIKKNTENREEVRKKIDEWKKQKNELSKFSAEKQKLNTLQNKKLNEKQKMCNDEKKKMVEHWKTSKITKEVSEKLKNQILEKQQKELRATLANQLIKEFQCQDKVYIQRKKESQKQTVNVPKRKPLVVPSKRDPTRLFKPTKQWISKTSDKEQKSKADNVNNVAYIPKLHIPEWRRQLT